MTSYPAPSEFPQSKTKTPKPLWKSLFSEKKILKVKNDAVCGYAMYGFHLILSGGLELEHRYSFCRPNRDLIPLDSHT